MTTIHDLLGPAVGPMDDDTARDLVAGAATRSTVHMGRQSTARHAFALGLLSHAVGECRREFERGAEQGDTDDNLIEHLLDRAAVEVALVLASDDEFAAVVGS